MRKERRDIFANEWPFVINTPLAALGRVDESRVCAGQVRIRSRDRTDTSAVVVGWTRLPSGAAADTVYIADDKNIVGIGLRNSLYSRSTWQDQARFAGPLQRVLLGIIPYEGVVFLGLDAAWAGAALIRRDVDVDELSAYVRTEEGLLCRVREPSEIGLRMGGV